MKRYIVFLLMLVLLIPTLASAHDFEVNGIYYIKNGTNAIVTYRGTSDSQYNEYSGNVTIPSTVTFNGATYTVTTIGKSAFCGCSELTSITIPNSVISIQHQAFLNCESLTSITIPNSVTSISTNAFGGCSGLKSVTVASDNLTFDSRNNCNAIIETSTNRLVVGCKNTVIPNSVTTIDEYAFSGCSKLTSITIPNSVITIGKGAFRNCSGLMNIIIPSSVTSIGKSAFSSCSGLTSIIIPDSVMTISDGTFSYCSGLSSVTIGKSVTSIGTNAFQSCRGLKNIIIPNSVSTIGTSAFENCSALTSISIPKYVTSIGVLAFSGCNCLTSMTVESDNTTYDSRDNCNAIIETASNTLISGCSNSLISNSVACIGNYAFYKCDGLTSITIGSGVRTIGSKAFIYCHNLQIITCLNELPPVMANSDCFSTIIYNRATLRVPRKSMEAFSTADYWYYFTRVEGWGSSGLGDVDGNGQVVISDVTAMIDKILGIFSNDEFYFESADFNSNGRIDIGDVASLIDMLLNL